MPLTAARHAGRRAAGFTLVELMITITLLAILLAVGVPSMADWVRNSRIRTAANNIQDGLRTAQAEALGRSRPMVFLFTNSPPTTAAASVSATSGGKFWAVYQLPVDGSSETAQLISTGNFSGAADGVAVTGPAEVCFSSLGRATGAAASSGPGASCQAPTGTPPLQTFAITVTGADRPLRVTVGLSGQVRMCDPARNAATSPDGCYS
ncbi:Tfp pilus assembly protein FimT/FimU [Pseudacidovorax sp. RU35E]|jgi:type IV fimbrial biogenesis protein FimT|uniref:pilus assembly FimT family protein n=1 Tax=Pseudacidovorax sp. RU35E TaxID=1907403 RepID=UPI00095486E6|nr:prepilin-type N-terminal cleavage/methylation domain-containing protein [Pseudacidovorax sp. RU35E]SIR39824.1 type IV fimbrial biogenesis protein FimT [Pseudacidovorax sp. RU35E]